MGKKDIKVISEFRIFFYSKKQESQNKKYFRKQGGFYRCPEILINGKWKKFTKMLEKGKKMPFADALRVASGENNVIRTNSVKP